MSCMDVSMCLTIDYCIPFMHDLRDFVDVYANQLNRCMLPIEGIDEIPQRDQSYVNVMHRLSLVDVQRKEKF